MGLFIKKEELDLFICQNSTLQHACVLVNGTGKVRGDWFCQMFAYLSKLGSSLPELVQALGILLAIQTSVLLPGCGISPELLWEDPSLQGATCLLGLQEHLPADTALWEEKMTKLRSQVSSSNLRSPRLYT